MTPMVLSPWWRREIKQMTVLSNHEVGIIFSLLPKVLRTPTHNIRYWTATLDVKPLIVLVPNGWMAGL